MRITEHAHMLGISDEHGTSRPVLLHDKDALILVDAGFPMQKEGE